MKNLLINNKDILIVLLMVLVVIFIMVTLIQISFLILSYKTDKQIKKNFNNLNTESLCKYLFVKYINIKKAESNMDFDTLKKLVTLNYYKKATKQLNKIKDKQNKYYIGNFEIIAGSIKNIFRINDNINVICNLKIMYNECIYNSKNEVVSGNKNKQSYNTFKMIFYKPAEINTKTCKNCHETMDFTVYGNCPNCNALLDIDEDDFKLIMVEKI